MSNMPAFKRPLPITWDFQIQAQGFVSRFGHLGEDFYRQYLPFGVLDDQAHPPKKILPQLYNLAKLKYKQSLATSTG